MIYQKGKKLNKFEEFCVFVAILLVIVFLALLQILLFSGYILGLLKNFFIL